MQKIKYDNFPASLKNKIENSNKLILKIERVRNPNNLKNYIEINLIHLPAE